MAKIIYAIAKEGMGHAIRSKAVIEALSSKHKIRIFAAGNAYYYLSHHLNGVQRIYDLDLIYLNNSVSIILTFLLNLIKFPFLIPYNLKLLFSVLKFKPDIMITDFEPFSNYVSYLVNVPLISIDNQNIITKCDIDIPKKYKKDFLLSHLIVNMISNNAKHYFITSFFSPKRNQCGRTCRSLHFGPG